MGHTEVLSFHGCLFILPLISRKRLGSEMFGVAYLFNDSSIGVQDRMDFLEPKGNGCIELLNV
jgi:hypothetical protein